MTVPAKLRRGIGAGAVGGALMSVSTNLEMRLRGRPPSRLPVQTVERFLPFELNRRQQERLVTVGHVITSAGLGAVRGLLDMLGVPGAGADAAFVAIAYAPDFIVMPAVGSTSAPWRWRRVELMTSAVHHGVYAAGTIAAYRWSGRHARALPHEATGRRPG